MKKKFVLVIAALFGLLLMPRVEVKAEDDPHYSGGNFFFANGKEVTITERTDGVEGAHLELSDNTSYDVLRSINIFGGTKKAPVESTSIIFKGGTVENIYGGGMNSSATVQKANITVEGGKVGYENERGVQGGFIYAGGSSTATVVEANIVVNDMALNAIKGAIVGSGGSEATVINSTITVNGGSPVVAHGHKGNVGTCKIIINNHSNAFLHNGYYYDYKKDTEYGYADKFETEIWGGKHRLMTTTSGYKDKDGNIVSSSNITKLTYYRGANLNIMSPVENFGTINENANEKIEYIKLNVKYKDTVASKLVPVGVLDQDTLKSLRTKVIADASANAKDVSEEFYYDDAFENVYKATDEIAKNSSVEEVTLYLRTINKYVFRLVYGDIVAAKEFEEGHEISEEELTEIFADFLERAKLTEEVFENMEFYLDEDMTEKIDTETFEIGPMDKDLTLYVNIAQHREVEGDEITENPDTADMNLVLVIGAMLVGSLGLGYTIKKRRFN